MELEQIISKLKSLNKDSVITLKNNVAIHLSDIESVTNSVSYDSVTYKVGQVLYVTETAMSLEKFIDNLKRNHNAILSKTFDYNQAINATAKNPVRNNGKWIYKEALFQTPIRFTSVEFGELRYIVEPMHQINSLISFMAGKKAITDIFNLNEDNNEVWWSKLDSKFKERILSVPVIIQSIKCSNIDLREYLNTTSILFDIPQWAHQQLLNELTVE